MQGMLMIEPLVHQTVKGNKTNTRRSGGLQEVNDTSTEMNGHVRSPGDWNKGKLYKIETDSDIVLLNQMFQSNRSDRSVICKPRYKINEICYIKEPWLKIQSDTTQFWNGDIYQYGAPKGSAVNRDGSILGGPDLKWKNKLFMPASAARHFIKIIDVRCERLLDISDEDCISEGIEIAETMGTWTGYKNYTKAKSSSYYLRLNAKDSFISLYKYANKMKPSAEIPNIWVWVYQFEYLKNYKNG